jgi:selenide,water dikinase
MLSSLGLGDGQNMGTHNGKIALDCSVRRTRQGHVCISTTDFFFPLVDNPYVQGRIGAANVLSDLYAEGVGECDFVLMLLAACRDMNEQDRNICTREMVRGFNDACLEAGTVVTGGQTVVNPWPVIGGVATTICADGEYVKSDGAQVGDVVVLTKPLGTQVAVNVHEWRVRKTPKWAELTKRKILSDEEAEDMMHAAVCSMSRLNRHGGAMMLKHRAHAGTDVTGFGILGHAQNLMDNQQEAVGMEIHTLPCIANTAKIEESGVFDFRLLKGYSAETSGGLMICMKEEDAVEYIKELEDLDGEPAWIIGRIIESAERKATILDEVKVLEISCCDSC